MDVKIVIVICNERGPPKVEPKGIYRQSDGKLLEKKVVFVADCISVFRSMVQCPRDLTP